ncbi:hypothetical protein HS088_TW13G00670 [Tripterygium wilfordii]|uniref:ENTH domain-containing protein n=1 Tax=Tripterygium wilfordii TaxID=458696 RepID=A0A7J7CUL4_TRIWF|nr:putative clathrin assembly protein At1g25240 [Tripterygium wilfordii]KAF5737780.1 hypothetical protein HS088_TW13G00670 [Tripterygium wilfordii]
MLIVISPPLRKRKLEEMKLWQRATGALKDRNSILVSSLARRTSASNPDLEKAIIKATSHDDGGIDYRNVNRVFAWVQASPITLKPLIYAISMRMDKTHSWFVALKGLMLMHGVFSCKTPAVQRIGRLPFDLSNFQDCHSNPNKIWGFEAFVRAYYAFLDQRSVVFYDKTWKPLMQELERLQKWQSLIDLLMKIKPQWRNMRVILILQAMDCVMIELCETYRRICNGIARVLLNIYSANKTEAALALKVLQKATTQGKQLSVYFKLCRQFGVVNATNSPKVKPIPKEDIVELERIINGVSEKERIGMEAEDDYSKAIMVRRDKELTTSDGLETIITDKWEVFDEDFKVNEGLMTGFYERKITNNPFETSPNNNNLLPLVPINVVNAPACKQELPDLISF